jgi:hypothetical protein
MSDFSENRNIHGSALIHRLDDFLHNIRPTFHNRIKAMIAQFSAAVGRMAQHKPARNKALVKVFDVAD